ncbi:MAG TPA: aromatic ring-hydroxylating dioxygenase subunit alpha [Kofleriaceae bacterium]|nr:aromatic ring-hydroxylating dioxygenase subunit alpha [Kofleriaceae bacterium]
MEHANHRRLTEQLRRELAGEVPSRPPFTVDAERYRSAEWSHRERALFDAPRIVAASAAVAEPGACVPVDLPGTSALLVRGNDGVLRAFANACRHRATRLVDAPCKAKAMVCPYHGWTYDLAGALLHRPHPEAFAGVAPDGLHELGVAERHGLVWLSRSHCAPDVGAHLGELDADIAALQLDRHVMWKQIRQPRRCNWKLVVEAFLDGYHIRILHRDSVYRFFLDAASVAEPVGPHIRALTARRALLEAPRDLEGIDLRLVATASHLIFPATTVIIHPDFISLVSMHPLTPDTAEYDHMMLVPAERAGEVEHWTKSWALIEEGVFQREDLWVCEQVQRGIASGSTQNLVFGSLEFPVRWFHEAIDARISHC